MESCAGTVSWIGGGGGWDHAVGSIRSKDIRLCGGRGGTG